MDASAPLPPRRLLRGSERLAHLVGHRLLVGVTFRTADGTVLRREQFCGPVLEVGDGVVVVDRGDEPAVLPADEDAYELAQPGTYTLSSTGEVVVDPEFVTTWDVVVEDDAARSDGPGTARPDGPDDAG